MKRKGYMCLGLILWILGSSPFPLWGSEESSLFMLKQHQLVYLGEQEKQQYRVMLEKVLDATLYDLEGDGKDELIVLTLNQEEEQAITLKKAHKAYGDELQIYELTFDEAPTLTLQYTSKMREMHPWKIEVGRMEDEQNRPILFVGVYKATRFYEEMMNRPFFVAWNGDFIERKWTGSYLSPHEYKDLIFVDFDQDGYDEVATLEVLADGSYQVSLYKWLTFGFQYLMSSKEVYREASNLTVKQENGKQEIWVQCQADKKKVYFK